MRKEAFWLLAAAVVLLAATAVRADTTISACQALSSGTTYRLTQDVSFTTSDCMTTQQASDVVLNCDGFVIRGNRNAAGMLFRNTTGVRVGNCTVYNSTYPVLTQNSSHGIIRDLVAKDYTVTVGVQDSSNNVSMINGHLSNSTQGNLFYYNVSGGVIRNITVTRSYYSGIELNNASGVLVVNVNSSRNVENGILLRDFGAKNNLVANNTFRDSFSFSGVELFETGGNNTILGNNITYNGEADFGIELDGSPNTVVDGNYIAHYADNSGIIVWHDASTRGSNGSLVRNNVVRGAGWALDVEYSSNVVFSNNTIINATENSLYIKQTRNVTFYNTSIQDALNRNQFDVGDGVIYTQDAANLSIIDMTLSGSRGSFFWRPNQQEFNISFTNVSIQNAPWGFVVQEESRNITFSGLSYSNVSRPFVKNQSTALTIVSSTIPAGLQVRNATFGTVNFSGSISVGATPLAFSSVIFSNHSVRISSTSEPSLNAAALVLFRGVTFSNPQPIRDHDEDGVFDLCYPPTCGIVGFSGGNFVFTVTGFSNLSITEAPPSPAPEFGFWAMMLALGLVAGGIVKLRKK